PPRLAPARGSEPAEPGDAREAGAAGGSQAQQLDSEGGGEAPRRFQPRHELQGREARHHQRPLDQEPAKLSRPAEVRPKPPDLCYSLPPCGGGVPFPLSGGIFAVCLWCEVEERVYHSYREQERKALDTIREILAERSDESSDSEAASDRLHCIWEKKL